MYDDPIVAETHRLREELAARFNNDLDLICHHLQEQERAGTRKVVRRAPIRPDRIGFPAVPLIGQNAGLDRE